ncbi:MAG: 30S ribosomal protein S4 [Candidatus Kerfeldbacteria bacterium]|nr:30S ribosomal protein S4 [Candidatus Kerfeldbacteria bacterium]
MGRNLNPRTKRARRLGEKLITHGEKAFSRRPYPPGQHGPRGTGKTSEYGLRLREKQKAQLVYGILERQFRRYVSAARRRIGNTGELLLQLLELRLDNVVFRAGFAPSREAARQLVRHGHISVNGQPVNIPSFQVKPGQTVAIKQRAKPHGQLVTTQKQLEHHQPPSWLKVSATDMTATVQALPAADDQAIPVNTQLIVEFYSR